MLHDLLQEKRELILNSAKEHSIKNFRIFGSVARLEEGPYSGLDLLVDFEKDRSLFDLIRFKHEVEELLEIKVDISTENSIHWSIKENVLSEAVQL